MLNESKTAERPGTRDARRQAQRQALLDAASEMLAKGGPDALSLRKLAAEVGASTMAVYTAFGNKDGLILALFEEAFSRLNEALSAVPNRSGAAQYLADLGAAYRRFALANRAYYALMVSATLMKSGESLLKEPDEEGRMEGYGTAPNAYRHLFNAVAACQAEGVIDPKRPTRLVADCLWAGIHGVCSLELAGYPSNEKAAETRFHATTASMMLGFAPPKD